MKRTTIAVITIPPDVLAHITQNCNQKEVVDPPRRLCSPRAIHGTALAEVCVEKSDVLSNFLRDWLLARMRDVIYGK